MNNKGNKWECKEEQTTLDVVFDSNLPNPKSRQGKENSFTVFAFHAKLGIVNQTYFHIILSRSFQVYLEGKEIIAPQLNERKMVPLSFTNLERKN